MFSLRKPETYYRNRLKDLSGLSSKEIEKFIRNENSDMRESAASNKNLSEEQMLYLCGDWIPEVRIGIAKNSKITERVKEKLSEDYRDKVILALLENNELSNETLENIIQRWEKHDEIREKAFKKMSIDKKAIKSL